MSEVVIYTTPVCPYCVRAKNLFSKKGIEYKEVDVSDDAALRSEMVQKSGGKMTVPQIFINGEHVGGYNDLNDLDTAGKLGKLL